MTDETKNSILRRQNRHKHGSIQIVLTWGEIVEMIDLIEFENRDDANEEILERVRRKFVQARNEITNRGKRG